MLFILPNEILLDIIDYLPFEDAISIFKIDSIKNLFDRDVRDQTLYRALFLRVAYICGNFYHDDKREYIRKNGNIDSCDKEILSIMKIELKPILPELIAKIRHDEIHKRHKDSDDEIILYLAEECIYYLPKNRKLNDRIYATFNWYVYRILERKTPLDIVVDILGMAEHKELSELYLTGIKDILSLDYKCKK